MILVLPFILGSQREVTSKKVDGQTIIDLTKPNKKGSRGKIRGRTRYAHQSLIIQAFFITPLGQRKEASASRTLSFLLEF